MSLHSQRPHAHNFTKFTACVNCGRGSLSSDDSAIRYVFPVLWTTSRNGPGKVEANRAYNKSDSLGAAPGAKSAVYDCLVMAALCNRAGHYIFNMVNFGLLTAEICWRVWGTPANFIGFRVLAALLK